MVWKTADDLLPFDFQIALQWIPWKRVKQTNTSFKSRECFFFLVAISLLLLWWCAGCFQPLRYPQICVCMRFFFYLFVLLFDLIWIFVWHYSLFSDVLTAFVCIYMNIHESIRVKSADELEIVLCIHVKRMVGLATESNLFGWKCWRFEIASLFWIFIQLLVAGLYMFHSGVCVCVC